MASHAFFGCSLGAEHVRGDTVGLGELLLVVDIDLGKCDGIGAGKLGGQRIIGGCNSFAWSAPVGVDYSGVTRMSATGSVVWASSPVAG